MPWKLFEKVILCSTFFIRLFSSAENRNAACKTFYLKTVKTRGIEFKYPEKNSIYFEPKDYDFIMFPGDLPHYPYPSLDNKIRISINMEIACKESISEIFNINNIKIDNINTKKRLYKSL